MAKAILYDSTLCVGCRSCESACSAKWGNPYNDNIAKEEQLSAHKVTAIQTFGEKYMRRLCMHCEVPTCASVCPVGALEKTALGAVVYDEDKCMGCRYCMAACPFQVPTYEWNAMVPRVKKCNLCYERQIKGEPTACTKECPTNATICGDRDAMIAEAKKRLAEKPGEYYPGIYGLSDVGGTSVFMISALPFNQLGLRMDLPKEPLPALTWKVLSHIPDVVVLGSVLLGGIWWITHRRDEVAAAEGGHAPAASRQGKDSW